MFGGSLNFFLRQRHVSPLFDRVVLLTNQLKLQALILIDNHPTAKNENIANCILKKAMLEHDEAIKEANHDVALECKAHLKFIDDILYDSNTFGLITDPMFLFNRGMLVGGYQYGIYQYNKSYNEFPHRLMEKSGLQDGNYVLLPELKEAINEFYKEINTACKNIQTNDINAPEFLIKEWADKHNLEEVVNPPVVVVPPTPPQLRRVVPTQQAQASPDDSTLDWKILTYAGCVTAGFILGLMTGFLTAKDLGLTDDIISEIEGEMVVTGYDISTEGWVYTGGLMLGFTLFLGCMAALYRSTKTIAQMLTEGLEAITPSPSTMSAMMSSWGAMISPDLYYAHQDSVTASPHRLQNPTINANSSATSSTAL